MAKLAVFFDGTWNTPTDRTNVYKLYKLFNDFDPATQQAIYVQGVGTDHGRGLLTSFKNFLGGAFGDGLSQNILAGYKWLINAYQEGDEIFLLGFSRGAYSARSLAGLIRNCGILRQAHAHCVDEAYTIYRDKLPPDTQSATTFRQHCSFEPDIEFIGVWDTVGSLGIPVGELALPGFKQHYQFHDTTLSRKVKAAYHALALNEFRSAYTPTLWTRDDDHTRTVTLPVEQRWFIGAHCNVGGGYTPDTLCNLSCRWIQKKAQRQGLVFLADWPVGDNDHTAAPHDSYTEFIREYPEVQQIVKRECRSVGLPSTLNETVDPSVQRRLSAERSFLRNEPGLEAALQQLSVGEDEQGGLH
jgi:uncharacterized protein (DUF2235 family)